MPNGAIVDAQGNITSVAGPEAQAPATPEAAPAQTRPKVGDAIETPEDQQAIRDALVPQPTPQNAAPLPDDTTPQQAFLAFENTLAGKRFTTPLGDTVSFNEGHFGRVTCAGTPEGKDNPSKRKGFIAGYPSAQAARQALREGKVTADQIQGYQPGRAALIPLIPDLLQRPQYIIEKEGAQHFVKQYDIGNGRTLLAVLRKFGDDLRIISFHPMQIRGSQLKNGRILFAEDTANLQWSAGTSETGMPPPEDTSIPQLDPTVNSAQPPAGEATQAQEGARPEGAVPSGAGDPLASSRQEPLAVLNLYELLHRADVRVHNVPLGALRVNYRIPQFKGDADPVTGEVAGRELQGEYQSVPAKPIVVIQWNDGTMEVATGRHRLGLARRNGLETIPANVIKESEGWTPESAGLLDAIDNVLDEKGAIQDYLKLFRNAGIDRATAQAKGLLARPLGRQAFEIAENASDDLYAIVMDKDRWVTADVAAAICREAPRPLGSYAESVQRAVARQVMDRRMGADDAAILARDLMHRRAQSDQARTILQDDLFGADDTALLIMAEQAAYAADKRRAATKDLQRVNAALQKGDALSLKGDFAKRMGITDPKDVSQLQAAADRLRQTIADWERYYLNPALSAEANAKAREILGLEALPVLTQSGDVQTAAEAGVDVRAQESGGEASDDLTDSLFSPTAPEAESPASTVAPNGAPPASPESPESPVPPGVSLASPAADGKLTAEEASAAKRWASDLRVRINLNGLTPEQCNGYGYKPSTPRKVTKLKGELDDHLQDVLRHDENGQTLTTTINTGRNAKKLAGNKPSEIAAAHQYAVDNREALYRDAKVIVQHLDKDVVKRDGNEDGKPKEIPQKHFIRLFTPFVHGDSLYLAILSQRAKTHDAPGLHSAEVLTVINAESIPDFTSRTIHIAQGDERSGLSGTLTASDNTVSQIEEIVKRALANTEDPPSILYKGKVDYTFKNPKDIKPTHLDGAPYSVEEISKDIVASLDAFVKRVDAIAKHRLQPGQELGTYTLANAPIHVALQEGRAIVTGLANIPQNQVADVLTALDAQLGPTLPIVPSDRPAPLVQNLIQARNAQAEAHLIQTALDKSVPILAKHKGFSFRFANGNYILTFPADNPRTYQENAAIVKAVKALLPEGTPLTLENTKSRMLQALAAQTSTPSAPAGRPEGAPTNQQISKSANQPLGIEDAAIPDTPQAQRDAVRNLHQGRGTWLKAPNGKRTKLPQKLWIDVRTPNFKRFFGDWENHPETIHPKLLDENGEPRVFWHNSPAAGIRVFDPTRSRAAMDIQGTYFSPDKGDAAGYGRHAYPVFIALKHPADRATAYAGFTPGSTADAGAIRAQELRDQGYDGVIVEDGDAPSGIAEIIVLDPNAIKSAGRNAGAYDPSTPDILANPAPESQGRGAAPHQSDNQPISPGAQSAILPRPSANQPAAGGSAASRTIVPPERIVGGVRVLTTSVYPMRGQVVGRLGPLGGTDGSPARTFGRKSLTTFDLALLYRDLTGGELPQVVTNRAHMGKALGRYYVGQNKIRIAAQIFGLIDESDIRALHDTLAKRGFFLHERPEWAATKTKKQLQAQAEVSEKALERELQKLLKRRIRSGAEPGLPAPKVLAHELWHLIDDQDGGLVGRGNLVGHLAALKRYTAEAFPVAGFAGNTELKAEAKAFITWWRGIGRDEPYFDQPEEMYAEIGAAYFCAPSVLQERAPNCFAAWDHAIQNHPRAAKAYADAVAYIANGSRPDLIHKTLGETWGREHDQALRRLNQAVQGFDNSLTAWRRRIIAALWDDRGPALDLVRKAYKERLAEIQEVRRKGGASDLALKLQERRLKALLDKVRLSHVLYRRKGPNNARLYLADVKGEFLERLTDIDPNPDIARCQVELYATYHRIIELGGRAAAYGVDPVQARGQLAQMVKDLGIDKFRMVVRAWNIFRALYERDVIERPATTELLGKDFVDLMRKNTHYVTTKHTVTPERLQALLDGLEHGKGGALELAAEQLIKRSGEDTDVGNFLKEYKGSLDPTKNPLLETIKTAVSIITLAERNQTVLDWVRALRALRSDEVQERPYAQRVRNDRVGYVEFYENGERKVLIVPRSVAAGFERVDSTWLTAITHTTRVINAAITTNNYGFIPFAQMRDLSSAVYNTPGLHRWTAHWLFPALGDLAALGAQFVPPAALRALAEHPLGKLLINKNTIEYWASYGNRAARLIHSGDFQGELERARQDRLAGNEASARDREFIVQMARQALRDGILLSMVQLRKQDYNESEWRTLFARYNLDFDDIPANESLLLKGAKLPARAIAAYWNGAGALSELASATVKLAAYCYLHQDALRPGAITPDGRPTDGAWGGAPPTRQASNPPNLQTSGGGKAAASPLTASIPQIAEIHPPSGTLPRHRFRRLRPRRAGARLRPGAGQPPPPGIRPRQSLRRHWRQTPHAPRAQRRRTRNRKGLQRLRRRLVANRRPHRRHPRPPRHPHLHPGHPSHPTRTPPRRRHRTRQKVQHGPRRRRIPRPQTLHPNAKRRHRRGHPRPPTHARGQERPRRTQTLRNPPHP